MKNPPAEASDQERASNHFMWRMLVAWVMSDGEKLGNYPAGVEQKDE